MLNSKEEICLDPNINENQKNSVKSKQRQKQPIKSGSQGTINAKKSSQNSSHNPSQNFDTEDAFDLQIDLEDMKGTEQTQQEQQKNIIQNPQNSNYDEKIIQSQSNTKSTGIKLEEKNQSQSKDSYEDIILFNSLNKFPAQQKKEIQLKVMKNNFMEKNEKAKQEIQVKIQINQKQSNKNSISPKKKQETNSLLKVILDSNKGDYKAKTIQQRNTQRDINSQYKVETKAPLHPNIDLKKIQQQKKSKSPIKTLNSNKNLNTFSLKS